METELKPCPFCGTRPDWCWHSGAALWLECPSCGMIGPQDEETTTDNQAITIAAWNTRAHEAKLDAAEARVKVLEEALREANAAQWFYFGDDCSSDKCRDCINACIDEDFEWDNRPEGDHVLLISGARSVPDMWLALHYYTDAEKDARDSDDKYNYTVHATADEARQALKGDA